jgi:hypothetical protein
MAIRLAGALGLASLGFAVGYLGPLLTGGINTHRDVGNGVETATIKVLDVPVLHETGQPDEVIERVERFWWRVFLPWAGVAWAVIGAGIGWVTFRPRRIPAAISITASGGGA